MSVLGVFKLGRSLLQKKKRITRGLGSSEPIGWGSKPFVFRPPKNNRLIIGGVQRLLPLMLRAGAKVQTVEVNEDDLGRLRELKGQRVVLTPSHSGGLEPLILFHIAKGLGEQFNYLAAKEIFEFRRPVGWLFQRLGAYSIIRGTPDRSSFRMTRQLLVDGKRWLVIFPEGHTCWQNDTVVPFQQGVAQLAFWACEDLAKQGELPPLYLLPVAIKYIYLQDMRGEIDSSLRRLECRLFSSSGPGQSNLYGRLRCVGEAVVSANEKEYNVRPGEEASLDERIQHMKETIISRVAAGLSVSLRPEQPLLGRIRQLLNSIDHIICDEPEGPAYESELRHRRQQEVRMLYADLGQVLRFAALRDGYVRETLSAERFLDVLGLLEREVFTRKRIRGQRKAIVKLGRPLNLKDYFGSYQADKRGALQEVTTALEASVQQMLDELGHVTAAIETV
jgi:1-acyl-sn-glycerol-3-phosphate acyltransferase